MNCDVVPYKKRRQTVVKTSLRKYLVAPEVTLPWIEEAVLFVSRATRAASMALNITLLDVLRKHNGRFPFGVDFTDHTLFNQLISVIVKGSDDTKKEIRFISEVERIIGEYPRLFPAIKDLLNSRDIRHEARLTYQTSFINHHVLNIEQRMKTYIRVRLGPTTWNRVKRIHGLVYRLYGYILNNNDELPCNRVLEEHYSWIHRIREDFVNYKNLRDARYNKETPESLQALVEFTYRLGCRVEQLRLIEEASQRDNHSTEDDDKPDDLRDIKEFQQKRSWSIAPIQSIKRHFVTFSATGLMLFFRTRMQTAMNTLHGNEIPWDMWSAARLKTTKKRKRSDPKEVYEIPESVDLWPSIFKKDMFDLRKSKKAGWQFDQYVRTDGVSVCCNFRSLYQRACSHKASSKKNKCGCEVCSGGDVPSQQPKQLVAIDPGCINIFYAVCKNEDGSYRVWKYRNKVYYDHGGKFRAREIAQKHLNRSAKAFKALSRTRCKTVHFGDHLAYWRACAIHDTLMWLRLFTRIRAKLAFEAYSRGMKTLDAFLKTLRDPEIAHEDFVIAYGAGLQTGAYNHAGTLSSPTSKAYKRTKRMYRTMLVNEDYTSQCCPHCGQRMVDKLVPWTFKDGRRGHKVVRSVKLCKSEECVERAKSDHVHPDVREIAHQYGVCEVSRDGAGAKNILTCAECLIAAGSRPTRFTRVGQADYEKQRGILIV